MNLSDWHRRGPMNPFIHGKIVGVLSRESHVPDDEQAQRYLECRYIRDVLLGPNGNIGSSARSSRMRSSWLTMTTAVKLKGATA